MTADERAALARAAAEIDGDLAALLGTALADDDGPDPVEDLIWTRLRYAGHADCASWTWAPDTGLIRCVRCGDRVVAAVDPDHPQCVAVGDPRAVRAAVGQLTERLGQLTRHTAPYADADLAAHLALIDRLTFSLYDALDRVIA